MSSLGVTANPVTPPLRRLYPERHDANPGKLEELWTAFASTIVSMSPGTRGRAMQRIVREAGTYAKTFADATDAELREEARDLRVELRRHGLSDPAVGRSFALVREISGRTLGMRHYDVQMMGAAAMLHGMIAEMQTGEGKTLTATLAAVTAALAGIHVDVVTVNDYLAERDAETMGPLYNALGLTVGVIVHDMEPDDKRVAYECDITYCTNKDLAFDYLRDQIALGSHAPNLQLKFERLFAGRSRMNQVVMRGLHFAIVDEADSVFVDEARTPLIISGSGSAEEDRERSEQALSFVRQLVEGTDFRLRRDERGIDLTDRGKDRLREMTAELDGVWSVSILREELATQALSALLLFHRDEHYLVQDDKVQIIDEYTGRVMPDRFWSEGLHQLIEVKEGCPPSDRRITLARITYQRFFRRYNNLAGMTGTAREVSREIWQVYRLPVATIPTHARSRRKTRKSQIVRTAARKWHVVAERAAELQRQGVPVLIGTRTVAASDELSTILQGMNIPHRVLSAAQDAEEADIVSEAGQPGRITVATNMAGRGTDIALGDGVEARGGLHVIVTERNDAARIDRQLAGRCARQGDPGVVETYLSMEDPLLEMGRSTMTGRAIQLIAGAVGGPFRRLAFRQAQKRTERIHSRMRRDLLKLDQRLGKSLAFSGSME